jgi:hypothetical protein
MNDYENGQIWGWNGGECPVHPKSEVNVWLRGTVGSSDSSADQLWWGHQGDDGDIVCFQVTKVHVEPKTIWVNEYKDGIFHAYDAKEKAMAWAKLSAISTAAKYVEVKE